MCSAARQQPLDELKQLLVGSVSVFDDHQSLMRLIWASSSVGIGLIFDRLLLALLRSITMVRFLIAWAYISAALVLRRRQVRSKVAEGESL